MNEETLDRLLLDRALGVSSPELDALLEAYLQRDPAAAARAGEFDTATDLAREVLKDAPAATLPPFPAAAVRQAERTRRQLVLVRNVASLAAAVLLGVGVGAWSMRESTEMQPAPAPPSAVTFVKADAAKGPVGDTGGFWSRQRLFENLREGKRPRPTRTQWHSPVREPSFGGTT